jgi:hypothetical protein
MIRYSLILLAVCYSTIFHAQIYDRLDFSFRYGMDIPSADMGDRFGSSFNPELGIQFDKKNYFVGIHGGMFLGPIVNEDVISNLRTDDGLLISQQEDLAVITMKQRGFIVGLNAGKFIPLVENYGTHGIRIRVGLNVLTHYIIFNNETASTNQLLGEYANGYDRLSRGWGIEEFVGYQYVSTKNTVRVFVGFNGIQARTRNLRPYNFDTRERDETIRFDVLSGIRVGMAISLFENADGSDIYY